MITQLHTSYMRRAAASSCAMQMHLVLQDTGETAGPRSRRCELSLLVRFNSTGLLARPWYRGVDQTCLSFASSRLPRLSMHSVYRVECRLGGPNPLKTFALSLSSVFSGEQPRPSFLKLSAFHRYRPLLLHPLRELRTLRLNADLSRSNFSDIAYRRDFRT